MLFFKPENDFDVRDALTQAGRTDLIGGCEDWPRAETAHPNRRVTDGGR